MMAKRAAACICAVMVLLTGTGCPAYADLNASDNREAVAAASVGQGEGVDDAAANGQRTDQSGAEQAETGGIRATRTEPSADDKGKSVSEELELPVFSAPTYEYVLEENTYYNRFTNYVQGYSMDIDKSMSVDMSYSQIGAVLQNNDTRIEIYRQDVSHISRNSYIAYSNKFAQQGRHRVLYNDNATIGGKFVHLLMWDRNPLSRVINDKNSYLCIELPAGNHVYSIFVKSAKPITNIAEYQYLLENFETFTPIQQGSIRRTETTPAEDRGWNQETYEFFQKYFAEDAALTWGIFEPDTSMFSYNQLDQYESYFGYTFPVLLNYSEFTDGRHPNLKERLDMAWEHGKVLELTLQTTATQDGNMMYDILTGGYDAFLYDYAATIANFGHPVMFRPMNEMNGDWCVYSAYFTGKDTMIYKEVYRYIYDIFQRQGANENTIWIWNPNERSYPEFDWNHGLMYYPGDEYVDLVGMTAYNTGTYYSNIGEKWEEFHELYDPLYADYCRWFTQPMLITEFACANLGGDKAKWINNMFEKIKDYPRIKMAIWWDGCDWDADGNIARSYFLDDSVAAMQAFKQGLGKPWWADLYA